jgi:hypothetical protein
MKSVFSGSSTQSVVIMSPYNEEVCFEFCVSTDVGDSRIILNDEDNVIHFEWCWKKLLENFKKENILIKYNGEHKDYMKLFFIDSFYYQKEKTVKTAIPNFINGVFNTDKVFAKSDLDILTELYKLIEKNIEYL